MRIEHHYHDPANTDHSQHVVHTERAAWNKMPDPTAPDKQIDMIDFLRRLIANPELQRETGWDEPSNHPAYPGKTKLQVVIAEIVRLHDRDALNALGM